MKEKKTNILLGTLAIIMVIVFSGSCSIRKMAMNSVADALTTPGGGNVFTSDNDPELIADALPFAIKMYESLLQSVPNHEGLRLRTGSLYIMYANAFLQAPSELLPEEQYLVKERLEARAKNLYLRGRDMLLQGLEHRHPGFLDALKEKEYEKAKKMADLRDIDHLYWSGAGWLGAFALDPFDMKLGITVPQAAALMERVRELNPKYGSGSIDDFYVLYYGALPEYMGGSAEKARDHFKKSVEASGGRSGSPYLSLATTVSINEQKYDEYMELLRKVLSIDPDNDPDNRLLHVINRRRAGWLLEHAEYFFVEAPGESVVDETSEKGESQ